MGRQRRKGENENMALKKERKENRRREWKSELEKVIGRIWATSRNLEQFTPKRFYGHSIIQHISSLLSSFFPPFFLTAKLLILSECAEIKVFLSFLMSRTQYCCLPFVRNTPALSPWISTALKWRMPSFKQVLLPAFIIHQLTPWLIWLEMPLKVNG